MTQICVEIERIGEELRALVARLSSLHYRFERPQEVLPGPERDTAKAVERIEAEIGAVPLALKLFWLHVGSINLSGSHPLWGGCEYPDPLIVFPPSYALYELDQYLADRKERDAHGFPYAIFVAPDFYHKANVSGGLPYSVAVPAEADDPPLLDEWHQVTFMQYLEVSLRFGGFPGLEREPGHSWPLFSLTG